MKKSIVTIALSLVAASAGIGQEPASAERYSLGRAIQVALANSPTLEDAEFGLQFADEQVREAWSSVLPDISANFSYSRNLKLQELFLPAQFLDPNAAPGEVIPIRVGTDNAWNATFAVSQPLFEVQAFIGVGAAGRFRALQQEVVRGTAQQVVSAVRQAYFNALLAVEDLRLIEESIDRVRQTLDETRAMNRAGLVSDYDVLRLEVQLANLEANVRRAENAVEAGKRVLAVEMGIGLATPIVLDGRLNEVDLEDPTRNDVANGELLRLAGVAGGDQMSYEQLADVAERRRSDLRQLRSTILLDEARISVERAEFFPKLSVFSNYNVTAQENGSPNFFGESSNQRSTSAVAGLRVEVPIFRGFARSARLQQARAMMRQDEARLERALLTARHQVFTLLDDVQEARQRAASQRRAVAQAQRGFEIASAEYRAGLGSQLQITDAEVALRESEFNYARAVYDYLSARGRLDLAIGTAPEVAGELRTHGDL